MMKKALILALSDINHDARVKRQIAFVAKTFSTTVAAIRVPQNLGVAIEPFPQRPRPLLRKGKITLLLLARAFRKAYDELYGAPALAGKLSAHNFDLIVANDIETLPLAIAIRGSGHGKILFDAHEYAPKHFENETVWRLLFQPFNNFLCRTFIPKTDAMITIGEGLASEYARNFKVAPAVITNAPHYTEILPTPVEPHSIKLVHHGIINRSRRLELIIEMMDYLDERFSLDLMLMMPDFAAAKRKQYMKTFIGSATKKPRVRIIPAVGASEVVRTINQYDIGVFLLPPVNFNYANTLPNKLFEFIQARLGIAIGPTPEMARIVTEFKNGVVAEDFHPRSLADKLNALTSEDVRRFKQNSATAARQHNAEQNERVFDGVVAKLFPKNMG